MQERSDPFLDQTYRYQRHIYDLTRKFYLLGRDRLISELAVSPGMSVLEIGCGTGRNLIVAARRCRQAKLFGLDLSAEMLKTASSSIARSGFAHRIRLARADAASFQSDELFGLACFDRVFLSYSLSMIPDWRSAIDRGWAAVAPGGSLHVVNFGQCENLPRSVRTLLFAWLEQFRVEPRDCLHGTLSQLASGGGRALGFRRYMAATPGMPSLTAGKRSTRVLSPAFRRSSSL